MTIDPLDPNLEPQKAELEQQGWRVQPGLSGYVVINPDGEMEWWRGVSATDSQAWEMLIRYPESKKPDISGATEYHRAVMKRLFKPKGE